MNNFSKYTILLAATSLCAINAANAVEKGKFYASGSYGVGFADKFDYSHENIGYPNKKPSNANVFGAAIGYGVTDNIRVELSYNGFYGMKYKDTHLDGEDDQGETFFYRNQKISADAIFTNVYYDISQFSLIKPYLGFGIGIANVKAGNLIQSNNLDDEQDVIEGKKSKQFAYQLGAGVTYSLNNKIDLNLVNYRYSNIGKVSMKEYVENEVPAIKNKLAVHSISTGITFKF